MSVLGWVASICFIPPTDPTRRVSRFPADILDPLPYEIPQVVSKGRNRRRHMSYEGIFHVHIVIE